MKHSTQNPKLIPRLLALIAVALIGWMSNGNLLAQPSGYCVPWPPQGTESQQYFYCWSYYNYFSKVQVIHTQTNQVVFSRTSGDEGCYINTGEIMNLKLGNAYKLVATVTSSYPYYYWYTRLFIDWNQNAIFANAGGLTEYYGSVYTYRYGSYSADITFNFTVPCQATPGKTMLRLMTSIYYDQGANACRNGYWYNYPGYYDYNYNYGETEDYIVNLLPDLEEFFPENEAILYANEKYNGETRARTGTTTPLINFKKPSVKLGSVQPSGSIMTYKIVGPLPSTEVVYEALDPATGSPNVNISNLQTVTFSRARGRYAVDDDGTFLATSGGEYKLGIAVSGAGCPGEAYSSFTVSWDNDLSVRDIVSPKSNAAPRYLKYLRGQTIKVSATFQNVGLNVIRQFEGRVRIWNQSGSLIYNQTYMYDAYNNPKDIPLSPGQKIDVDFPNFRTNEIGIYRVQVDCDLQDAIDQEDYNDHLPRPDDNPYYFEIAYEIQLASNAMLKPKQGEVILGNRPIIPVGEFKNLGVGDASDVPAKLNVYKLPITSTSQPVYTSNIIVQDVPAGKYNTKVEYFDPMEIKETGDYMACLIINHIEDVVRSDDTLCIYFSVEGGLSGTYTIGTTNSGSSRNFPTIDSAMNALYYRGLAGPVVFELTDANYTVKSQRPDQPAWDFTTYIINSGYNNDTRTYNTITFKPSIQRSLTKGGVTITLQSANGKGIQFGQSLNPSNPYSLYNQYQSYGQFAKKYANSMGYITFDGGSQKSIKFKLQSYSSVHGSAIYLGRGSTNISIKNCIIENATPSIKCNTWLPMTLFNQVNGFRTQADTLVSGSQRFSYSAGIVNRNSLFGDEFNERERETAQLIRVDTIPNVNNVISGNEIYGFGYGVLSLGLGPLWMENDAVYRRWYNKNNEISNNRIYDVCRAGIYLGYEENTVVTGNRIHTVTGSADAAGIIVGGDATGNYKGYNNVGIKLNANEISNITASQMATGIRIRQDRNVFPKPAGGQAYFPDIEEGFTITNNAIWGIGVTNTTASRAGIHLFTQRQPDENWITQLVTPFYADYYSKNDKIINNTIIMAGDGGLMNTGAVVGVGLQQVKGAQFYNNAVALLDNDVDQTSPAYAALFLQGQLPKDGSLMSDRNVFWATQNSGGGVARFIELDKDGAIVDLGEKDDLLTLSQWRNWTKQDINSVFGNFTQDLTYIGTEPNQKLRINMVPQAPLGSLLNNRGNRIPLVTHDIDGNVRGGAGQRYDVGASEFDGRMYILDVELLGITEPSAYKANTGTFSDAEYIMTTAPVEIKAQIRNNGNLLQSGVKVTVRAYLELPMGGYSTTPAFPPVEVETEIPSMESVEVAFGLANGIGTDFIPQTYADLIGTIPPYVVPAQFRSMTANVTPKYKLEVSLQSDEYNANNIVTKVVRFYIQKSTMRLILSAENSMINIDENSTQDVKAGRLNADTVIRIFNNLGWFIDPVDGKYDYDVFDRKGWEPKAVNYPLYRTMVWSDGNDKALTRYERIDIRRFLDEGNQIEKKNLLIASQEMVRQHSQNNANKDLDFVNNVLRASTVEPENPLGVNGNNNNNAIAGWTIARDLVIPIKETGFTGDAPPYSGLMAVYSEGEGLALPAGYYIDHTAAPSDSIAGVATTTLTKNVVLMGSDWRHWGNATLLFRGLIDFVEKNGGTIIPVELLSFDAQPAGNRVNINWATASEYNTDRFEVERATANEAGKSQFIKIAEEKAAGVSNVVRNYGPVVDRDVQLGNTYVYRLKMLDVDGKYSYSNEVEVRMDDAGANWLSSATPNPSNFEAKFFYTLAEGANIDITLYDINGKAVMNLFNGYANAGTHEVKFNTASLANGAYNYVLKIGNQTYSNQIQIVK